MNSSEKHLAGMMKTVPLVECLKNNASWFNTAVLKSVSLNESVTARLVELRCITEDSKSVQVTMKGRHIS